MDSSSEDDFWNVGSHRGHSEAIPTEVPPGLDPDHNSPDSDKEEEGSGPRAEEPDGFTTEDCGDEMLPSTSSGQGFPRTKSMI